VVANHIAAGWIVVCVEYVEDYLHTIIEANTALDVIHMANLHTLQVEQTTSTVVTLCVCLCLALLGSVFMACIARAITQPLKHISVAMKALAKLDFTHAGKLEDDLEQGPFPYNDIDNMSLASSANTDGCYAPSPDVVVPVKRWSMEKGLRYATQVFGRADVMKIREIGTMHDAFEHMYNGLRSFSRYMDPHVVQLLVESKQAAQLGVARADVTIFFSDIANFTSMAEEMTPTDFMKMLARYLDEMSKIIMKHNGVVGEFIGDAIMAWWNVPIELGHRHSLYALYAAAEQQQRICELRQEWLAEGKPEVHARMGLVRGNVLAGNIGSTQRMKYGLVGDSVNLASRLEGLCKKYGTSILIDDSVWNAPFVADEFLCRPIDLVVVKGRRAATQLFEPLACTPHRDEDACHKIVEDFTHIHGMYRTREFERALQAIDSHLCDWPGDQPALLMKERCEALLQNPPDDNWTPAVVLNSK
jgi:class 3 adenylate cyclase